MTLTAFLLIFVSIFLHAGWNFMSKATRPSAAYYLIANAVAAVVLTPFLFLLQIRWENLGCAFWSFLAGSVFFEVIYAIGLFRAYKQNDISMAYPMVRALPVLFTAVVTMVFGLGKTPGVFACCGFAVVALGCFLLPQKQLKDLFSLKSLGLKTLLPILIAACGTTGYTLMDSLGTVPFRACSSCSDRDRPGACTGGAVFRQGSGGTAPEMSDFSMALFMRDLFLFCLFPGGDRHGVCKQCDFHSGFPAGQSAGRGGCRDHFPA